MKILVLNCGSSSLKYQLFDMDTQDVLAKGLVERIGFTGSVLTHKANDKKLVIEVTDEKLIDLTGGIIQGMSGSPIIQDGKIIGAVTHVFVNDPTEGYGILIEDMMK